MPRAALLSIHARVERTTPTTWEDPSLVQLWGPRFHAYVVPARDVAIFTVARLPEAGRSREVAEDLAARLHAHLRGARMTYGQAGRALGVSPNALRYAATTGTIVMRWDGARQPTIWNVPRPEIDPLDALRELARRYLHIFGPATPESFARWAGIAPSRGIAAFDMLARSLIALRTPIGDAAALASDEATLRESAGPTAPARLLPSGDAFILGDERELVVPDADRRRELWTPRVWPGGVLVDGEVVGTWRRANAAMTIHLWHRLSRAARDAIEAEAHALPLPGVEGRIAVRWDV